MPSWQPLPESLEPLTRNLVERLRCLKDETGMSLAELARRTAHSKSAWHRYLNGSMFPPRSAVKALAQLVQADEPGLIDLWTRAQCVSAQSEGAPLQPLPTLGEPSTVRTLPRPRVFAAALVMLVLCAAAVAGVITGGVPLRNTSHSPGKTAAAPPRPSDGSARPACKGETCEGRYSAPSGCDRDARTESTASMPGYSVHLRFSPSCGTVWAEVHSRAGDVREISIRVEPKAEFSAPPSDRFPTSSPILATMTPQAAEACGIVGDHLVCTSPGEQEISFVRCPSHTDGLRPNDHQCEVACSAACPTPVANI
ncbi:DUF2690 domain-containing protein [Streptomyces mirabilis]|uniref:helix-turn-helix domain-containing protein n=1 Tax=Streptomyces mirabilis TaxID=68239 RepID=UPI003690F4BF